MVRTKGFSRTGAVVAAAAFSALGLLFVACGATTFKLEIEASPQNGGSVSPTGTIKYSVGTKAEVTATANEGYMFTGWSGVATSTSNPLTVTMNSNQTLTANFEKIKYLTDPRDGQKYRTVKIGDKTWMAENLNFKTDNSWCYNDDESKCQKYGRLYDWNAAMETCPAGWRLPSLEDWNDLIQVAGGGVAGKKLKSKTGWHNNGNGTDDFGFSALPGGGRYSNGGSFNFAIRYGYWWSATEFGSGNAFYRDMHCDIEGVNENNSVKGTSLSVRCVQ